MAPKDSSIFYVMDCPTPLRGEDAKEVERKAWGCLVWKPKSARPNGGMAVPSALVPTSAIRWHPKWIDRVSKYVRDRGDIASAVVRGEPLASTSPSAVSFKWAEDLNLLTSPWESLEIQNEPKPLRLDEALRLLKDGSWGLVLKRSGRNILAVGLAPLAFNQGHREAQ